MTKKSRPDKIQEKDLFLCHSSVDKPWVETLGQDLEAEEWDGRPLTVFLDAWDIDAGENIVLKLNDALASARFVAVVMTPEMLTSDWCKAEWSSVLHQDPTNRRGRLLPIRRRDVHLQTQERLQVPPMLDTLNYFDFRRDDVYAKSLARLLAKLRGQSPPRGNGRRSRRSQTLVPLVPALPASREEPDAVPETLISNLLPVRAFPTTIWAAPTKLRQKADVPKGTTLPPFILRDGSIYTFSNLPDRKSPFRSFITPERITRSATLDWRQNEDRWRWFIELMNITLGKHLWQFGVSFDRDHQRYYFRQQGSGSRYLRWGTGTRRRVVRAPDTDKKGYWVHHAARLRFEALDNSLYLSIEPAIVFTTDGRAPVSKDTAGPLSMKWTGKERNGAILRHVLMWSDILTSGKREVNIEAGEQTFIVGRLPTTVRVPIGIADDHVNFGALLTFTQAEMDLAPSDGGSFAYLDVAEEEDAP